MKFEPDTINIIRNFNQVTESGMRFPKGNVLSVRDGLSHGNGSQQNMTTVAIANLRQSLEKEFLVYDPIQFFSALSLFENPIVEIEDTTIIVSDEKSRKTGSFKFVMASPDVVSKAVSPDKFPEDAEDNVRLHLDKSTISLLFKAVGIVMSPYILFVGQGGDLFVCGYDKDNPTADQYSMPIGVTDKEFKIPVRVESINKLMKEVDYDVTLTQQGVVRFVGDYNGNTLSYYFIASV